MSDTSESLPLEAKPKRGPGRPRKHPVGYKRVAPKSGNFCLCGKEIARRNACCCSLDCHQLRHGKKTASGNSYSDRVIRDRGAIESGINHASLVLLVSYAMRETAGRQNLWLPRTINLKTGVRQIAVNMSRDLFDTPQETTGLMVDMIALGIASTDNEPVNFKALFDEFRRLGAKRSESQTRYIDTRVIPRAHSLGIVHRAKAWRTDVHTCTSALILLGAGQLIEELTKRSEHAGADNSP
jgi:hypothetical protein